MHYYAFYIRTHPLRVETLYKSKLHQYQSWSQSYSICEPRKSPFTIVLLSGYYCNISDNNEPGTAPCIFCPRSLEVCIMMMLCKSSNTAICASLCMVMDLLVNTSYLKSLWHSVQYISFSDCFLHDHYMKIFNLGLLNPLSPATQRCLNSYRLP